MAWFTRKVQVTFIDDVTGAAFATADMPPANLPESFAFKTTLQLGNDHWSVIHAEPQTRSEYAKSGTLTLRLRKLEMVAAESIRFSQLDITERFDDNLSLGVNDWISTTPLNATITESGTSGLPSPDADVEEVYRIASMMSELREALSISSDGVYCPICHIANIDVGKLRTPCPQCGRELLRFGWD